MKHNRFPQNEKLAIAATVLNGDAKNVGMGSALCPDEVARRAYFAYVNEGSPQGRDVQHWLDAEARLLKERNATRTHEFATHK